ncbi:sugar transferase [Paenibacillus agaridevorans]|uniref:sugar transferase n=1 Tax=Paenibacillus agaridevorans TaxID=171404 RepID=UPI001BE444D3|nr:sugar transferase [Paenibacillus agaridevorans]
MYKHFLKRFIDLVISLLALPFWLIILFIIGPAIYFHDKGSIFYNAPRLGRDGKVFSMYKFRSMKMNSPDIRNQDGSTYNSERDPRLTKIGHFLRRTSLDETPQLLNIIKGDMSIIGPRPDLPDAALIYTDAQKRKLAVRPGITGYNQAYFRNSISQDEKFGNDVYYVSNLTLKLDIKIFFITLVTVLKKEKINNQGFSREYNG